MKKLYRKGHFLIVFENLRISYENGNIASLREAFIKYDDFYKDHPRRLPGWMRKGITEVLKDREKSGKPLHKGAAGNETSRAHFRLTHAVRWACVSNFRTEGLNFDKSIRKAKKYLEKTDYQGGYAGIRKSYYRVEKVKDNPLEFFKYIHPSLKDTFETYKIKNYIP